MCIFREKLHSNVRKLLKIFDSNKLSATHDHRATIKQSYGEEFSGLVDASGKHRQFSASIQRENLQLFS
jgi:hypothetical protein